MLKIEGELMSSGKVAPAQRIDGNNVPGGPGSILLTSVSVFMLRMMSHCKINAMLWGYRVGAFEATGVLVFPVTTGNFFARGINIKVSSCKPNTGSTQRILIAPCTAYEPW